VVQVPCISAGQLYPLLFGAYYRYRKPVKDRMDLTSARWGLSGAEALLRLARLRALRSNNDFEDYWRYHLAQERHRVHQSRYAGHVIPRTA
jgi:hypothetical protein